MAIGYRRNRQAAPQKRQRRNNHKAKASIGSISGEENIS
jgi:hypothetical protein